MPSARCSPVPLSPICAPVTSGGPSSKPVVEAAPPAHCATFSYTLHSSYGPGPKPLIEATIIFGFSCWMRSQVKPMRSSAPGAKFSTSTSQCRISRSSTALPRGFLVSRVIERLLWFSMVKYRLSAFGMSCSCPRVTSPAPALSTLMTSAPNHASSCVQVGPDCTCVKSRMRTPSNALPMSVSGGRCCYAGLLVHGLVLGPRRVLARVHPDVDDRRALEAMHRFARPPERRGDLRRVAHFFTVAAEHLGELAERHVAEQVADVAALLAVLGELPVADLVHGGVVADHCDVGHAKTVGGLHVERRHAERAVAVVAQHLFFGMGEPGGDRKAGADAERAERARIHPLSRAARPHGLRGDRYHVAAVADVDGVVGKELVELPGHTVGVDRRVVGFEQRHELFRGGAFRGAQLLHPLLARLALVLLETAGGRLQHRAENRAGAADQPEIDVAVLADGAVVHVDLHQLQLGADAPAVAHAEVERCADDHDDVGVGKRLAAGAVEVVRIAGRDKSAAAAVEVARDVEPTQQRDRLLVATRGPHLLTVEDRGALGIHQDVGQLL